MKRCAFLTTDDLTGHVTDDELAYGPFRERGWAVDPVSWRRSDVDWTEFDAVVIRSTWDYQEDPEAFMEVLQTITDCGTPLANSLSTVRWNLSKTYLRDLQSSGVAIVPTSWRRGMTREEMPALLALFSGDEIVVKPVIGASAGDTFRLSEESFRGMENELQTLFRDRDYMVQPFMRSIAEEGEFSLFYFSGDYSHAVLKSPKTNDFRVQEEHGGEIIRVRPPRECLEIGASILREIQPTPLYARVDLVRDDSGGFLLMELELIEPALYFRTDETSADRFAAAFEKWSKASQQ